MRRAVAVVTAAFAAALGVSVPAAHAQVPDFTVVNTVSQSGPPATGAFLTVITTTPVTDENTSFSPWVTRTPRGLAVRTGDCFNLGPTMLPILSVGPSGTGGTKINVYHPNNYSGGSNQEPFICVPGQGGQWTVEAVSGVGPTISKPITTVQANPGMFTAGSAPAGYHLDTWTGLATSFSQCNSDFSGLACPVSTHGLQNFLILFTSGGELFGCPDPYISCTPPLSGIGFSLAPGSASGPTGPYVAQSLTFFGFAGYLGQEQANVRINAGTVPGEKRVKVTAAGHPASGQQLVVKLGAPAA